MSLRSLQFAAVLMLSACGSADGSAAQQSSPKAFAVAEVARFDAPWALAFLPGSGVPVTNAALVTEKAGKLWLVDAKTGQKQEVSGVPGPVNAAGQGGLAEVVAHPDFAGNQRVYLSYSENRPNGGTGPAVGYGRLLFTAPAVPGAKAGVSLQDFKVIWRGPSVDSNVHYSQRIAFAPDGTMFVSSGDRFQFDPAQDPKSDMGKIIHMTAEGQRIGGQYSMGHRNALGLAFATDGRLWETEMGPKGGDELNLILQGKNYGWPNASYGSHYSGMPIPDDHKSRGFEEPKVWWNPSVSPGSLLIYSGSLFPQWKGDALIGALSGQALIRVDINGDQAKKADQWDMGARIRAVGQGPGGEVYLLEDGPGGRLLRLTPAR